MSKRVDFVDRIADSFKDQAIYNYWRSVAEWLDGLVLPSPYPDLIWSATQGFVGQANIQYKDGRIKTYEAYSSLYNMSIGMAYDEAGDPYITNEDYEIGPVDIKIYDPFYQGDFDDFSLVAGGPAGMLELIRESTKLAVEAQGGSVLSIDVMETETRRVWFLPLTANYAMRVFYHGSPPIALPVIIALVKIALIAIGINVVVWRVTAVMIKQAKKVVATQEVNKELLKIAQDPATPADMKREILKTVQSSQVEVSKNLNIPKSNPLTEFGDIIKYAAIGLGLVLAFQVFQSLRPARQS